MENNLKAKVEAALEANWQKYGYSSKPQKYIALTFDDGPCAPCDSGGTQAMLEMLDKLNVKATFFLVGELIRKEKAAAKAIFDLGHELGNHSDVHIYHSSLEEEEVAKKLKAASEALKEITGEYPFLFRPPYLDHSEALSLVCKKMGMPLIDGAHHYDWPGETEAITASVLENPQDGGIIMLHENNTSCKNTEAALPKIIAGLREKGFWVLTAGELAAVKEISLQAGTRYHSMVK